jgi:hypothetical protein
MVTTAGCEMPGGRLGLALEAVEEGAAHPVLRRGRGD